MEETTMSKVNVTELAQALVDKHKLSKSDAENFIQQMFAVANDALGSDRQLKVRGLGTFKVLRVKDRESVDVNTGERIVIEGRDKITYTPDAILRDIVNKPFAQFETVVIADDVDFTDINNESGVTENAQGQVVEEAVEPVSQPTEDTVIQPTAEPVEPKETSEQEEVTVENTTPAEPKEEVEVLSTEPESTSASELESESVTEGIPEIVSAIDPASMSEPESITEPEIEHEEVVAGNDVQPKDEVVAMQESLSETDIEETAEVDIDSDENVDTDEVSNRDANEESDAKDVSDRESDANDDSDEKSDSRDDADEDSDSNEEDEGPIYDEDDGTVAISRTLLYIGIALILALGGAAGYFAYRYNNLTTQYEKMLKVMSEASDKKVEKSNALLQQRKAKEDSARLEEQQNAITTAEQAKAKDKADAKDEDDSKTASKADQSGSKADDAEGKYPSIPYGAYNIVGIDRTVTAHAGQTAESIGKAYLGPGMACYIEALNGKEIKEGQKVKIPKLKLKAKKKK